MTVTVRYCNSHSIKLMIVRCVADSMIVYWLSWVSLLIFWCTCWTGRLNQSLLATSFFRFMLFVNLIIDFSLDDSNCYWYRQACVKYFASVLLGRGCFYLEKFLFLEKEFNCCECCLLFLSGILIVLTFPFSLCVCIKVWETTSLLLLVTIGLLPITLLLCCFYDIVYHLLLLPVVKWQWSKLSLIGSAAVVFGTMCDWPPLHPVKHCCSSRAIVMMWAYLSLDLESIVVWFHTG